ncbi:MAG TPA: septum formation initiator family protein [Candidatus Binataceae bacterium]|jgi:cell division protein FtsB
MFVTRLTLYLRSRWLTLALAGACVLLAGDFVSGPSGLRDLIALRGRRAQLEAAQRDLLKSNAELKVKFGRLGNDDRYLERRIREELGYVRPNELVYRFATEDDSAQVPSQTPYGGR